MARNKNKDKKVEEVKVEEAPEVAEKSVKEEAPKKSSKAKAPNYNTAVIKDGKKVIRSYSLDIHGKDFAALAEEFIINRKGYVIDMQEAKPGKPCPACGHMIFED